MFHKLRLKLTLINVSIILILFTLLISGTYYFARRDITHRSEMISDKIMRDLKAGMPDLPPPREHPPEPDQPPRPDFFFVKTAADGTITFISSNAPLKTEDIVELVNSALLSESPKGLAKLNSVEYPYLKSFTNDDREQIILFRDFTHELNFQRTIITALIITGIICLALSFCGSFYMANRAMQPIQQTWQQQIDFLSDASHELRTPLSVIQTNLDIVMSSPEERVASQMKWLQNIQEESFQMARLVDSLLLLARFDANHNFLTKQPFLINEAVRNAALPFEPLTAENKINFSISAKPQITINGDELRIKQVVGILLDNAIRHTPAGGRISVMLSTLDNTALLTVSDTGEGIAPQELDKIFNRFYQIDKSRSSGGTGLGLSIAKCIVENHDGRIAVESTPGSGTTFNIFLPIHKYC